MKVRTSVNEGKVVTIRVEGDVDAYTARLLDKALNDLLAQGHRRLLLDATQMRYISSLGLRAILAVHRQLVPVGGELRVFGLQAQALKVFEMAGFEMLVQVSASRDSAMEGW